MKKYFLAAAVAALLLPRGVFAEGFALNEWSAEGVAMGGARMFAEGDAANLAYNPASLTKIQGEALKAGVSYISPHGKYEAETLAGTTESGKNVVHPGWAPGSYYVKQMTGKDWFGIGAFSRFAMISEFPKASVAGTNAYLSELRGISINPVYAHKFDKKWSAAVGAEVNFVGLELHKNLFGAADMEIKGESYALGWNAAANYTFDEKNEMGVSYRSRITHSLEADTKLNGTLVTDAYGVVTLPDSWSIGYNHKFNDATRVELNATRTMWSTYDALNIAFNPGLPVPSVGLVPAANSTKDWESGWRYAIGAEHKLSDKYTLMGGIAYDKGAIPSHGADFMVPTGDRRTYSIGVQYHDKKQTVAAALGYMDIGGLSIDGHTPVAGGTDLYKKAQTHDNYCKIISVSYQLNF